MGPRCNTWPVARVDMLCEQLAEGARVKDIAARLGVSTNAALGQINRMRAANDPRLPALHPRPRREPEPPRWWHPGAARIGSSQLAATLSALGGEARA